MLLQPNVSERKVQSRLAELEVPLEKGFKLVSFWNVGAALAKRLFELRARASGEKFEAKLGVGVAAATVYVAAAVAAKAVLCWREREGPAAYCIHL